MMVARFRTAMSVLRLCARGPLRWATPALAILLLAGALGMFAANPSESD